MQKNPLVEVGVAFALIAAFLWAGRRAFPGVTALFAATLIVVLIYSHHRRGESFRDIGFRLDTFAKASLLIIPFALSGAVAIAIASAHIDGARVPSMLTAVDRAAQFVVLGIVQQYLLVGFFFNRIRAVSKPVLAVILTSLIFAVLHLPNLFLASVTLLAGAVSCFVYQRAPNLWANGIVHGLLACLLYYALPRSITGGLRVGADYLLGGF